MVETAVKRGNPLDGEAAASRWHIFIPASLAARIRARGPARSGIIRRDLERLYALYDVAKGHVDLSRREQQYVADAWSEADMPWRPGALPLAVRSYATRRPPPKGVTLLMLNEMLPLDAVREAALVDACERWAAAGRPMDVAPLAVPED